MAVKNDRGRLYKLEDTGTDGVVEMAYVRQPSTASDEGYWFGFAYISGSERSVGAQAEHTVIYDSVMDAVVPLENTDDAIIARLGEDNEELQFLKVLSVGHLRSTGEKIARCLDVSDADYTLTT